MSTPSIASNPIPNHHLNYGYSPHQNYYPPNTSSYSANNTVQSPGINNPHPNFPQAPPQPLIPLYRTSQRSSVQNPKPQKTSLPVPHSQSDNAVGRGKKRADWREFYKNGLPKEVILIKDDTPPPSRTSRTTTRRGASRGGRANVQSTAGRKRKADDTYDTGATGYHDSPAFSTHPAKFDDQDSSAHSMSSERTNSLHTTAPTSLGSLGSSGARNSYEEPTNGQKRKRAAPKVTRAQTKRKEQEANAGPFADYVPPPKPPLKAADVHVPVVAVVSTLIFLFVPG